ncbi:MAG: NAD(P)-dependent oxidoreductase [Firmicutes bacterium]|nr:NAD(P)-dependent oxidoreductase [Bacillota bacterium]
MKVLITGGTGFLGQKLAIRLQQIGYMVTIVGRNEKVGVGLAQKGMEFLRADLRDSTQMKRAIKGKDYVFHCGALSAPWGHYSNFYETNVIGTENVIAGCMFHGVRRLIHVSSPSIYFEYRNKLNVTETQQLPRQMVNYYAKTKYMAEQRIDDAFTAGLPVVTIRPRAIFGPGDTTIFPRLIRANQRFGIPLIDGGQVLMDITYVENIVEALILAMDSAPETLGKKYNISNGTPVPLIDLLQKLFLIMGLPLRTRPVTFSSAYLAALFLETFFKIFMPNHEPPFTCYTVGLLSKSLTLNIATAKKELGFEPKISIDEGLKLFADWWREQ